MLAWISSEWFVMMILAPDPAPLCLGEWVAPDPQAPVATTTVHSHARRKRPELEDLDESGLRFDDTVPVRKIEIPTPELDTRPEDTRTEINEKVTDRLAQEPGAEQVGQTQSLLVPCVFHDVDRYTYLVDVLQRIDRHPRSQVQQLTPRLWKQPFAVDPLRFLLYRAPP